MHIDDREQAAFYRAALLLGLLPGHRVVAWADDALGRLPDAPPGFVELAATPPDDLTGLRHQLLSLCDEKPSPAAVRGLLGLVHRDLASGRRTFKDTMTVLKQLRSFVAVGAALNDRLKTLGVGVAMAAAESAAAEAEQQVREWLRLHEADAEVFTSASASARE